MDLLTWYLDADYATILNEQSDHATNTGMYIHSTRCNFYLVNHHLSFCRWFHYNKDFCSEMVALIKVFNEVCGSDYQVKIADASCHFLLNAC